jgi:hypothetical protein
MMFSFFLLFTTVLQLMKLSSSFTATTIARSPAASYSTDVRGSCLYASALIIQNKGGGHGELGYQIAKNILQNKKDLIDSITILQDSACKDAQEPFKSYATDLPTVNVIKANLSDEAMTASELQAILGGNDVSFDYVWDNASKAPIGAGKACLDCAKSWLENDTNKLQLYVYVSSAGVYKPTVDTVFPMSEETTPVKSSAGQVEFEIFATELELPFVSFRPQYIYGEKANKFDYMYVTYMTQIINCFSLFSALCFSQRSTNSFSPLYAYVVKPEAITFLIGLSVSYRYQFQEMAPN